MTGGTVTRGRRVNDRRDLFEMTVRPDADGDVTIALEAGRDCAVSGAICTKGENRRRLTNSPLATVAGPAAEPLTARFEGMPEERMTVRRRSGSNCGSARRSGSATRRCGTRRSR